MFYGTTKLAKPAFFVARLNGGGGWSVAGNKNFAPSSDCKTI
ncbi:hypothetical protein ACFSQ5_04630 [Enterococcus gallinarum]|nr:hypothetical protein RV03_GL003346 [Enterococcus gallinarum]